MSLLNIKLELLVHPPLVQPFVIFRVTVSVFGYMGMEFPWNFKVGAEAAETCGMSPDGSFELITEGPADRRASQMSA